MHKSKRFLIVSGKYFRFFIVNFLAIYFSLFKKTYIYNNRLLKQKEREK